MIWFEDLKRDWNTEVMPRVHAKGARKIQHGATDLLGEVNDAIRDGAEMMGARSCSPEAVREHCNFGLARIFG